LVLLYKSAFWLSWIGVCEEHTALQQRMAGSVHRAGIFLIHEKDHLAARLGQRGPVACTHGSFERWVVVTDVVRQDHFAIGKDRANFLIERIERFAGKGLRL